MKIKLNPFDVSIELAAQIKEPTSFSFVHPYQVLQF